MKIIIYDFELFKNRVLKEKFVFYNFKLKRKSFFDCIFITEIMGTDKENNLLVYRKEDLISYDDVIQRKESNYLKALQQIIEEKKHEMINFIHENFKNAVEGLLIMEAR